MLEFEAGPWGTHRALIRGRNVITHREYDSSIESDPRGICCIHLPTGCWGTDLCGRPVAVGCGQPGWMKMDALPSMSLPPDHTQT